MAGNIMLLYGLGMPSMKADVVSGPGYGFGHCDGQPLGGRPPAIGGPITDVPMLQTQRYVPGVTDYAAVIASSAGAGSVEGLAGIPMPSKWWHWAAIGVVGYLAWTQWGK